MEQLLQKTKHSFSIMNTKERPYLKWLSEGIKTAEGRVNAEKYQNIEIGEYVLFHYEEEYIYGTVKFKHEYSSFREMLLNEGVPNMLPFLKNDEIDKAVEVYNAFPGSERVKIYGCVAIGIDIVESHLK